MNSILIPFLFLSPNIESEMPSVCDGYGQVIYVDKDAVGANNGTSWTNAFVSLQDARSLACGCPIIDEIWVAAATYYPDEGVGQSNNNRSSTFSLCNGVAIYGGFAGGEIALGDRNWILNETILSGDIDQNLALTNNAYHVVKGSSTNNTAILDGFTIKGGNANGTNPDDRGGGMYNQSGSPLIMNCLFTANSTSVLGGAMHNSSSNPTITRCQFTANSGLVGGAINNTGSIPVITGCLFSGNTASSDGGAVAASGTSNVIFTNCIFTANVANYGGAVNISGANPVITNCKFSGNKANVNGGAIFNYSNSHTILINNTFSGNNAITSGGAIYNWSTPNLEVINCIIWNNRASNLNTSTSASIFHNSGQALISYSLIANSGGSGGGWQVAIGTDGGHNIDVNPMFVTTVDPATAPTTAGNLHLLLGSPAIDAGNHTGNTQDFDLDGNNRFVNCIDMGSYEFQTVPDNPCPGFELLAIEFVQPCLTAGEDSLFYYPTWSENVTLLGTYTSGTQTINPITAIWSSSNPAVATIVNGHIEALNPGISTLSAQKDGITGTLGIRVISPALAPVFQVIPVSLSTPNDLCAVRDIPVLIIRYIPTADGINLDVSHAPDFAILNPVTVQNKEQELLNFDNRVRFALEEGSRYRDYGQHITGSYMGYRVVDIISVYEPTPRGKVKYYDVNGLPCFDIDYYSLFERFDVEHYINDLGVKEVWLWQYDMDSGYPSYNPAIHTPCKFRFAAESNMSSPITGDVSNSNQDATDLPIYDYTFVLYGQNLRRSQAEAIHNHGHQIERMIPYFNQIQDGNTNLFWRNFVGQDINGNFITGRCGWTHMPPNTITNYDYLNTTLVLSDIRNWKPSGGVQTQVNVNTWGTCPYIWPGAAEFNQRIESQWYIFWFQSIPGNGNTIQHGANYLTNWWDIIADWDYAVNNSLVLYSPVPAATVSKHEVVTLFSSGYGTLRSVIDCAQSGSTITFSPFLSGIPYTLLSPINIDKTITVDGGSISSTILNASASTYGFNILNNGVFTLKSLQLTCGQSIEQTGIRNFGQTTLQNLMLESSTNAPVIFNKNALTIIGLNSINSN